MRGERRQVEMAQVRKHLAHALAGLAVGGQRRDAQCRVGGDQPDQLGAGIAAGAEDRDALSSVNARPLSRRLRAPV